jgi:hypothetical protein
VEIAAVVGGEEAAQEEAVARRRRQLAWLSRGEDSRCSDWKAKRRPRAAAYAFRRYVDNQVA